MRIARIHIRKFEPACARAVSIGDGIGIDDGPIIRSVNGDGYVRFYLIARAVGNNDLKGVLLMFALTRAFISSEGS